MMQRNAQTACAGWQAVADIDFESELQLEEKIGSGAFGSVYRGAPPRAPAAQLPITPISMT